MDKKTTGLVATIATALLCGCPGLLGLCMGGMFAIVGTIPGSNIDIGGSSDPAAAIGTGIAMLCVGLIFVAIPVVVWFVTLRKKPEEAALVAATPAAATPAATPEPPKPPAPTPAPPSEKPAPPADDEPLPPAS